MSRFPGVDLLELDTLLTEEERLVRDTVRAFVGSDSDAPLGGSGTFDGRKPVNAFYLAGGLNATYIDDIRVSVDDG